MRAVIADDEPLARSGLRVMLAQYPDVEVVGEAVDGDSAAYAIETLLPDLLFIDVQMPRGDAFSVLERVAQRVAPATVFVTAHEEYAYPAFEANAVDYLLKPFDQARLRRALDKATRFLEGRGLLDASTTERVAQWRSGTNRFVVKDRGTMTFVEPGDIEWIESWGNYVRLFVNGRPLLLRQGTNAVAARLDPSRFLRISRRVIVNADHVRRVVARSNGQTEVVLDGALVLIGSRRYRERLRRFFTSTTE